MASSKTITFWRDLNVYQRIETLESLSKDYMQKEIAEMLDCGVSTIQSFCRKYNMVGIWSRGARDGNKNALRHGLGRNTIKRLTKRVLLACGRDLYKCERCSFENRSEEFPRHHKDRDRTNNDASNLEVLCKTCHGIEHISERERNLLGQVT